MSITSSKIVGSGISFDVYSRQKEGSRRGSPEWIMSRGELMNFATNPRRYIDGFELAEDSSKATEWGSLIDMLVLTPENYGDHYATAPATYSIKAMECPQCGSITDSKSCRACKCDRAEILIENEWNSAATECRAWAKEQGDREIVKSDLFLKAETAIKSLHADEDVSAILECSRRQVMCVATWQDKATGLEIPLRVLIDLVPDETHPVWGKSLCNLKTARCGDPNMWARVVDDLTYDVSAAMEMDIYVAATGQDKTDFVFPIQENVHPYHVVKPMPALTMEFIAYGRAKYEAALVSYARCLSDGVWPSYPTRDRLVLSNPPCQLIGPDSLYSYRQSAGLPPSQRDYEPPKQNPNGGPTDPDDYKM